MFIWLNCHFFSPSSYFLSTEPRARDIEIIERWFAKGKYKLKL
ncbi:hypothetical protein [Wolbachia endosymbiont of Dactylopius coccus]